MSLSTSESTLKWTRLERLPYVFIATALEKFFSIFYFYYAPFSILVIPYLYKYFYPHHDTGGGGGH